MLRNLEDDPDKHLPENIEDSFLLLLKVAHHYEQQREFKETIKTLQKAKEKISDLDDARVPYLAWLIELFELDGGLPDSTPTLFGKDRKDWHDQLLYSLIQLYRNLGFREVCWNMVNILRGMPL